jgi:hypothetical protein
MDPQFDQAEAEIMDLVQQVLSGDVDPGAAPLGPHHHRAVGHPVHGAEEEFGEGTG